MLKKTGEFIESPNKYIAAIVFVASLWFMALFVDAGWLQNLVFNPFWPLLILLINEYISAKKINVANKNANKVERISAILVEKTDSEKDNVSIQTLISLLDDVTLLDVAKGNIARQKLEKTLQDDPIQNAGTDDVIPE